MKVFFKHLIYATVTVCFCFLFISCNKSKMYVMSGYKGKKITGKTLTIAQIKPRIDNPNDVLDDLGEGEPVAVFKHFFEQEFPQQVKNVSYFQSVRYDKYKDYPDFNYQKYDFDGKPAQFFAPNEGETVEFGDSNPEFILFFITFKTRRKEAEHASTGHTASGEFVSSGGSFGKLVLVANYYIWDNIQGKLVSYGKSEIKKTVVFAMTKGTWQGTLSNLAQDVLKDTPFYKDSYTEY